MVRHETGVDTIRHDVGVLEQALQEGDVRGHTLDLELAECAIDPRHQVAKSGRRRVPDELGQQRIEMRAHRVADVSVRVDPQTGARRHLEGGERAARGPRDAIFAHRLHVDAYLHRKPARLRHVGLPETELGERAAGRQLQLNLDEIDARHLFGYRVLHLQPGIGLVEGERPLIALGRLVEQELEGAQALVTHLFGQPHRRRREPITQIARQPGARRNLDDLLVLPLDAALALPEVADAAGPVTDDLHLDVARSWNELLDIHISVAKGRLCLRLTARVGVREFVEVMHRPHAAAAAARQRLDHDRNTVAQGLEKLTGLVQARRARGAGQDRYSAALCQRPRLPLAAE